MFLTRYMQDVAAHTLAPRTILSYQSLIDNHIKPALGSIKLNALRVDHLQKLYSDKLKAGLSRRTVQYIHQFLHTILNYAVKWRLVAYNVASQADPPKQEDSEPTVLTVPQVKELLQLVKETPFETLYLTAVTLGLREGELLAITWDDVSFEKHTIRVDKQLQYLPGKGLQVKVPKTSKAVRTLPLPDITYQALRTHKMRSKGKIVFATGNDTYFYPRNVLRHFHGLLAKMGMPIIPFHSLRHSCASFHLLAGTNPRIVQAILGHSRIQTTLDIYSHMMPGLQEEAAKNLDRIFS